MTIQNKTVRCIDLSTSKKIAEHILLCSLNGLRPLDINGLNDYKSYVPIHYHADAPNSLDDNIKSFNFMNLNFTDFINNIVKAIDDNKSDILATLDLPNIQDKYDKKRELMENIFDMIPFIYILSYEDLEYFENIIMKYYQS